MVQLSRIFIAAFCMFFAIAGFAQIQTAYEPGELLIQTADAHSAQQIVDRHQYLNGTPTQLKIKQHVSPHMRVWLVTFDHQNIDHNAMLYALAMDRYVSIAQSNHIIKQRATPNDSQFGSQWQYINTGANGGTVDADIDADEAWDITTGGLTALGDTIVACVIDDGIDFTHTDFGDNLWINYGEIPNDNIDNDGNGYVDDYRGWDANNNNDNVSGGGHGTPVAGIVGAKGDNGIGVAGVNWNVKLMIVQGGGNESQAIAAYSYPLEMRKRYNQSNGNEGAFVVSTNASWGIDGGQPANAPLWCAMYDTLGVYGILNAGATTNSNTNVDVQGDLPTACPSDYLISVTNMNRNDNKVSSAGYGSTTIDIGAHGQDAFTVAAGNSYGGFGGTSGATPHVTGAIALLYSAPCPSFAILAKSMPDSAALLAKRYILDGGDTNSSLQGITTSGNRLNLRGSLDLLMNECDTNVCAAPFALSANNPTETDADLDWLALPSSNSFTIEWRAVGAPAWNTATSTGAPYTLSGLMACTDYEFRVNADCGANGTSNFSSIYGFKTDGCCEAPASLMVGTIANTTADIQWTAVTAANTYDLRYRETSGGSWIDVNGLTGTSTTLSGLMECTDYEAQIRTVCDTGVTSYTSVASFTTLGCGACIDLSYCAAGGGSADEWIGEFTFGTVNFNTGNNNGYGDFTGSPVTAYTGWSYPISMTPDYPAGGQSWNEYFMLYIDYNHDGDFDDANETVFDAGSATSNTVNGTVVIPVGATTGITRMRLTMQYDDPAASCEANYQYGEVEDYCLNLRDTAVGIDEAARWEMAVYPNPANDQITVLLEQAPDNMVIEVLDATGRLMRQTVVTQQAENIQTSDLPNGVYLIRLVQNGKAHRVKRVVIRH